MKVRFRFATQVQRFQSRSHTFTQRLRAAWASFVQQIRGLGGRCTACVERGRSRMASRVESSKAACSRGWAAFVSSPKRLGLRLKDRANSALHELRSQPVARLQTPVNPPSPSPTPASASPPTPSPAPASPRQKPAPPGPPAQFLPGWRWIAFPVLILAAAALGWHFLKPGDNIHAGEQPSTVVARGPLTIDVSGSGTVRPRQQIVLRNEMDRDAPIVFIVKEGTVVKAGDLLVELDATYFEDELSERLIRLSNAEAGRVRAQENFGVVTNQAKADVDQAALLHQFAELDLKKYLEGEYPKMVKDLEAKITLAEEELNRAREVLRWSEILFSEKYLAQSNLRQDQLSVKKGTLNVELASEELMVMTNFTHPRRLTELRSNVKQSEMGLERARGKGAANIAQAQAEVRAMEAEHEGQKGKVQRLKTQIARASIRAPIDGMVLYASSISEHNTDDRVRIQQGAIVDKKGEIIYLPTAESFDVDIRVPEVNLAKLRLGLPALVVLDAMPSRFIEGKINSIASLPDSQSRWMNPNLKFYNTVISLNSNEVTLRNGMSCRVEIQIEKHADALYVPIQSVTRHDGQPMVYLVEGNAAKPVAVELGMDNNRVVQIVSGLQAGQRVLLAPPLGSENKPSRAVLAGKLPPTAPIAAGLPTAGSSKKGLVE